MQNFSPNWKIFGHILKKFASNKINTKASHFNWLIRIDFSYSRNEFSASKNEVSCSLCANSIYGAQFRHSKYRHLVSIENSRVKISAYDCLIWSSDHLTCDYYDYTRIWIVHQPVACPVRLRRWDDENSKQF